MSAPVHPVPAKYLFPVTAGQLRCKQKYNLLLVLLNQAVLQLVNFEKLYFMLTILQIIKIKNISREVRGAAPHLAPEQLLFSF